MTIQHPNLHEDWIFFPLWPDASNILRSLYPPLHDLSFRCTTFTLLPILTSFFHFLLQHMKNQVCVTDFNGKEALERFINKLSEDIVSWRAHIRCRSFSMWSLLQNSSFFWIKSNIVRDAKRGPLLSSSAWGYKMVSGAPVFNWQPLSKHHSSELSISQLFIVQ